MVFRPQPAQAGITWLARESSAGLTPADDAGSGLVGGAPLACAGYGSIVTVTASMGLAAAARAMDSILERAERPLLVGAIVTS